MTDDPAQRRIAGRLNELYLQLQPKKTSFLSKDSKTAPRGVYIWGSVGRGKSMLMDMFFETLTTPQKRRIHFHAFMLEVHARIHQFRQHNRKDLKQTDPIAHIAQAIAKETRVLCLDEMQVADVADAMILSRFFATLFDQGVVVLFTSNRPPESLYLGGLQRELFVKFIDLIGEKMDVLELSSPEDYRLKQMKSLQTTFNYPLNAQSERFMDESFALLTGGHAPEHITLEVQGRQLEVKRCVRDVARFTFPELCSAALGAADYIAICQQFRTILLENIPLLTPENRNEAKRFVTLIDALYEHKVKLLASAAAAPHKLYPAGDGSFEFERTVSRLIEMQSAAYLSTAHIVPAHVNLTYE